MKSLIYEGRIEHRRYDPVTHHLSYPVYFLGLDLGELPDLGRRWPLFGYNRTAVSAVMDRDYLAPGDRPLDQKIGDLLARSGVKDPVGRMVTITSARYFNYVFNPVSFHYCFSKEGDLAAVVAEVNNTYGERHPYVLTRDRALAARGWFARFRAPKAFHVSPFNRIEGDYIFSFSAPGPDLKIRIDLVCENRTVMSAELRGEGRPLTLAHHVRTMRRYPVTPHLSIPRIYTQAFRLFFRKKLPFYDKPVPRSPVTMKKQRPGPVESLCMRLVFTALRRSSVGGLTLVLPDARRVCFGPSKDPENAVMTIHDYHFFPRLVFDGEIGLGEAYMACEWDSPDPVALMTQLVRNRDRFSDGNFFFSLVTRILEKRGHDRRRNSEENSPDNIRAHYDLSNAFYRTFLDEQMLYSCGIFTSEGESLSRAQENKMQRIIDQVGIRPGHHVLEIGCGWGGFAIFAAKTTGCRVTGITLSRAQYDLALERVRAEGLEDRITILLQDYRHTTGCFDRIVSIEMIEAVGPQYFPVYFRTAQSLLRPGGRMVFQAITIENERYPRYCRERDWIQKHIFPGGHLPCLEVLKKTIASETDFQIEDIHPMGRHYATTLSRWRERFLAAEDAVRAMGFDRTFRRKWLYYFAICEAGFTAGGIDDIQVTLALP